MILVTGATGAYGTSAIKHLLEKGVAPSNIAALVRNPEKASSLKDLGVELRMADYNDYDSLVAAFQGVDKLLFVSGSDIATREAQHENIIKAAKAAHVGHIAYTSFIRKVAVADSAIGFLQGTHEKTENWIKESGINYTILQNALYMDMIPMFVGEGVAEIGAIVQPAEQGKSTSVLRDELAEAAAEVLTSEGHENKTYPLSNVESLSYQDIAEELTAVLGKDIQYQSPSPEEFQSLLKGHGVPEEYINLFTAFSVAQAKGELDLMDDTLEKLLGRKPATAKQFLTQAYS
ncbi:MULTISPECIES: SDR family oxidoreductase [Flavobacteriaceae]|uniref:SDR family oxidoreductase n=1 Tax=Flavobacteriaceae TaxID=49546 RepID=UPI001492A61C|nr:MULTISPECIES: SDR family oxidoreductase [Allomuricauda]MDC6364647.1 SDR family oxidoreductase [Muricauda sp. AC10]